MPTARFAPAVTEVNDLAASIATLNAKIGAADAGVTDTLRDAQNVALRSWRRSSTTPRSKTRMGPSTSRSATATRSSSASQRLPAGRRCQPAPTTSRRSRAPGTNVTAEITSGRVGGLLKVRDVLVPGYMNRLDQLAFDVVSAVNTVHQAGFDANGNPGGTLFTTIRRRRGGGRRHRQTGRGRQHPADRGVRISDAAGDNQNAKALADLRTAPLGAGTAIRPTSGARWSIGWRRTRNPRRMTRRATRKS